MVAAHSALLLYLFSALPTSVTFEKQIIEPGGVALLFVAPTLRLSFLPFFLLRGVPLLFDIRSESLPGDMLNRLYFGRGDCRVSVLQRMRQ